MWHGISLVKICCFLNHYLSFHILVLGYREEKPTEDSPHAHKCNRTLQEHHINPQSRFRSVDWNRRRLQAKKFQYSFFSWRKCGTTIAPLVFHNCFLVCIYRKADKVHVVPIWYYWDRGQNRGRSKVNFEYKPGMVSMAEVLSRVKRAPSPSSSFCSPSIQQAVVATTLWPSVPSWNSNESSLL